MEVRQRKRAGGKTGEPRPDGTPLIMSKYPQKVQDGIASRGGLTNKWIGVHAQVFLPKCKEEI
jgi:hypothetical protein